MEPSGATASGLMIAVTKSFVEAEAVSMTQVRQGRDLQISVGVKSSEETTESISFIEFDGSFYSGKKLA
jgi:hypothetical protein